MGELQSLMPANEPAGKKADTTLRQARAQLSNKTSSPLLIPENYGGPANCVKRGRCVIGLLRQYLLAPLRRGGTSCGNEIDAGSERPTLFIVHAEANRHESRRLSRARIGLRLRL